MIEKYLNQECKITISFATISSSGMSSPCLSPIRLRCKITGIDKEFVEIEFNPKDQKTPLCFKDSKGHMIIKKDYIICITLI